MYRTVVWYNSQNTCVHIHAFVRRSVCVQLLTCVRIYVYACVHACGYVCLISSTSYNYMIAHMHQCMCQSTYMTALHHPDDTHPYNIEFTASVAVVLDNIFACVNTYELLSEHQHLVTLNVMCAWLMRIPTGTVTTICCA